MRIADDHLYHGAALIQIAEHPDFKTIDSIPEFSARGAWRINKKVAIYIKYATKPKRPFKEYNFMFNTAHWSELHELRRRRFRVFILLVCVRAREICCLTLDELTELNIERMEERGNMADPSCMLLVSASRRERFNVYMNQPGTKKRHLTIKRVARNAFPKMLFEISN